MKIIYRSPGLIRGFFSAIGRIHIHIDGACDITHIIAIAKALEKTGNMSMINVVVRSIAGPQRQIFRETYESHTPELHGNEAFEFFMTTYIKNRMDAIYVIDVMTSMLKGVAGVVIEMEQVIGMFREEGVEAIATAEIIKRFAVDEVSLAPCPTLNFEIHHRFNLPKDGKQIELPLLLEYCNAYDVELGGLFVFEKQSTWAYRSNSFTNGERLIVTERERRTIGSFLVKEKILNISVETQVEKIIGIWHL